MALAGKDGYRSRSFGVIEVFILVHVLDNDNDTLPCFDPLTLITRHHYPTGSITSRRRIPVLMKPKVKLLTEGKLSGGLTAPVGTVCTVVQRYDEKDFYSNGRVTLDVLKDDAFEFTVFEDEVEYLKGTEN